MTEIIFNSDDRLEVLGALQHGLDRTLLLARTMFDDPVVGSEARGLHSQLTAIQAEVDLIAAAGRRRNGRDGDGWNNPVWH